MSLLPTLCDDEERQDGKRTPCCHRHFSESEQLPLLTASLTRTLILRLTGRAEQASAPFHVLSNDTKHGDDIKSRFSGGVYFMSLGEDVNVWRVIERLCMIVKVSGGSRTAPEMREQSYCGRVSTKTPAWFSTHVCFYIVDDV